MQEPLCALLAIPEPLLCCCAHSTLPDPSSDWLDLYRVSGTCQQLLAIAELVAEERCKTSGRHQQTAIRPWRRVLGHLCGEIKVRSKFSFLTDAQADWVLGAVEEALPAADNIPNWELLWEASEEADGVAMDRAGMVTRKPAYNKMSLRWTQRQGAGFLYIFHTKEGHIAGGFRFGFQSHDERAFIFSLVRPDMGAPLGPEEPIKLKGNQCYVGGGATFCFGSGNTGQSDLNFNYLVPFVCSNLQSYGTPEQRASLGSPVAFFGTGEAYGGDRFQHQPDILLCYRIAL